MTTNNLHTTADRELVMTRTFMAPKELVFKVWTEQEHVAHWWGPKGFTITTHEMNVKPGGLWRLTMHGPDGTDYPNRIQYHEVVKPEAGLDGKLTWSHGGDPGEEEENFEVTVTFSGNEKQTEIMMKMVFRTKEKRDMTVEKYGAIEGNTQTMDRLEAYLKAM